MRRRVNNSAIPYNGSICEALEVRLVLAAATGPVISELLASNLNGLTDQDGGHSDWVELFNPTLAPVVLDGWALTDDVTLPAKWTFPDDLAGTAEVTLSPGARMVVVASNKNRRVAGQEFHTNFALGKSGEYLGLYRPDGTAAFEYAPTFPAQPDDISYGVLDDDATALRFFNPPTPGAPNTTEVVGVVSDAQFSVDRGFYNAPFTVALSSATVGASIRYTLDGSPPSDTAGTLYTTPVNVTTTTTLRAIAYKPGLNASAVGTETYIFLNDVIHQPANIAGWPNPTQSISLGTATRVHDYEMDPQIVNDPAYSADLIKGLTDIPTISLVVTKSDMWDENGQGGFYRTSDLEKPVSVEIIDPKDPSNNVHIDAGVELHSNDRLKNSLRLNFGTPLVTSLLQDAQINGGSAVNSFKRLVLRGGMGRCWARDLHPGQTTYAEDQWFRDTQIAMSGYGPHGNFVHLYINGLYWGLYNPTERPNHHFSASYFGGNKDDWFSIHHDGEPDGDPTRWNYLTTTLKNKDLTVLSNYREFEQYLDTTNFTDYILVESYVRNTDWLNNNWWASNRNDIPGPTRFFTWDGEETFGVGVSTSTSAWIKPELRRDRTRNEPTPIAALFNAAKTSPEFLMLLADRTYKHTSQGGALSDAAAKARWDMLNNYIQDAVVAESARWGDTVDSSNPRERDTDWQNEVNRIRNWMTGNGNALISALRAEGYYPTNNPATFSQHGGTIAAGFNLKLANPNTGGTIYYTTDGSDPRLPGGGISGSAKTYSTSGITLNQNTQVRVRVRSSTGEWSAIDEATFTIANSAPLITQQPIDRLVPPGEPATFSVTAVGTPPLSYQWQRNGVDISGATGASYTIPAAATTDNGATFRVVVSNAIDSVSSDTVTLYVGPVTTSSIIAGADAYVRDGSYATQNFGTSSDLVVKQSRTLGNTRQTYLGFDLEGVNTVGDATLRLFGHSSVATENVSVSVYAVSDNFWSETAINWNDKPASDVTPIATTTVSGTAGKWYEFDVSRFVQERVKANAGGVAFVLKADGITDAQALFNSAEAGDSKPELFVHHAATAAQALVVVPSQLTVPEGASTSFSVSLAQEPASDVLVTIARQSGDDSLTAAPTSITFTPADWNIQRQVAVSAAQDADTTNGSAVFAVSADGIAGKTVSATEQDDDVVAPLVLHSPADAYVRDGSYASTNFGTATQLQLKEGAVGWTRYSYVRFDLSQLSGVSSAKLRLYARLDNTQSPSVPLQVLSSTNTTWTESGLTWNNKPAAGTALLGTAGITGTTAKWYEIDITAFLQQQRTVGAAAVTLVLRAGAKSNSTIVIDSDEGPNRPELSVIAGEVPQALVVSKATLTAPEGNSGTFTVRLAKQPASDVLVSVARQSGDTDLGAAPASLTFNSANWDQPQTVTVTAAQDVDATNGSAVFAVSSSGLASKTVTVTEVDDDTTVPVTLSASDGAYVRDGTYAGQNFGSLTEFQLKKNATGSNREIWLKFNLSSVSNISIGKLRLFGRIDSSTETPNVAVYSATGTSWTEGTLTWYTRPAVGPTVRASQSIATSTPRW
jgi:hypothetical protein